MHDDERKGPGQSSPFVTLFEMDDHDAFRGERRTAKHLEDLVSDSRMPYHEITEGSISKLEYHVARTNYDPLATAVDPGLTHRPELAYYCEHDGLWIQGAPEARKYNNIGRLSGSSGVTLHCRICKHTICHTAEMRSATERT